MSIPENFGLPEVPPEDTTSETQQTGATGSLGDHAVSTAGEESSSVSQSAEEQIEHLGDESTSPHPLPEGISITTSGDAHASQLADDIHFSVNSEGSPSISRSSSMSSLSSTSSTSEASPSTASPSTTATGAPEGTSESFFSPLPKYNPKDKQSIQAFLRNPQVLKNMKEKGGHYIYPDPARSSFIFVPNGNMALAKSIKVTNGKSKADINNPNDFEMCIAKFAVAFNEVEGNWEGKTAPEIRESLGLSPDADVKFVHFTLNLKYHQAIAYGQFNQKEASPGHTASAWRRGTKVKVNKDLWGDVGGLNNIDLSKTFPADQEGDVHFATETPEHTTQTTTTTTPPPSPSPQPSQPVVININVAGGQGGQGGSSTSSSHPADQRETHTTSTDTTSSTDNSATGTDTEKTSSATGATGTDEGTTGADSADEGTSSTSTTSSQLDDLINDAVEDAHPSEDESSDDETSSVTHEDPIHYEESGEPEGNQVGNDPVPHASTKVVTNSIHQGNSLEEILKKVRNHLDDVNENGANGIKLGDIIKAAESGGGSRIPSLNLPNEDLSPTNNPLTAAAAATTASLSSLLDTVNNAQSQQTPSPRGIPSLDLGDTSLGGNPDLMEAAQEVSSSLQKVLSSVINAPKAPPPQSPQDDLAQLQRILTAVRGHVEQAYSSTGRRTIGGIGKVIKNEENQ